MASINFYSIVNEGYVNMKCVTYRQISQKHSIFAGEMCSKIRVDKAQDQNKPLRILVLV